MGSRIRDTLAVICDLQFGTVNSKHFYGQILLQTWKDQRNKKVWSKRDRPKERSRKFEKKTAVVIRDNRYPSEGEDRIISTGVRNINTGDI